MKTPSMIGRRLVLAGLATMATLEPPAAHARMAPAVAGTAMLTGADFGLAPNSTADQSAALQKAVDAAAGRGLPLFLAGGMYRAGNISIGSGVTISGVAGATGIIAAGRAPIFHAEGQSNIGLEGLGFDGSGGGANDDRSGLLAFSHCDGLRLDGIAVRHGASNGLFLDGCSGRVSGSSFSGHAAAGIFAINSRALTLGQNDVADCGNAGILVWRDTPGADGTIVSGNHVSHIAAKGGGSGQNGNGINIFRADNVIVAGNVIDDCDFSAVRANSTRNVAIRGNTCTRLREVAIYSEFAFSGSVIEGNIVDGAAAGISITNLDSGGRLAVCSGNIIRNITPNSPTSPDVTPYGIYAEADTAITGNTVSDVPGLGIGAGIGKFLTNVLIADNVISGVDTGIGVSVADGAGPVRVAGNMITGVRLHGLVGMRWTEIASADLVADAGKFANVTIEGNVVGK